MLSLFCRLCLLLHHTFICELFIVIVYVCIYAVIYEEIVCEN
ncbi:hypothetical protein BN133_3943 [Cronobacter dublinensis 582]|nr:hypothetical protein BN133_3943 [Cronobacter dublinensis 582]